MLIYRNGLHIRAWPSVKAYFQFPELSAALFVTTTQWLKMADNA